MRHSSTTYKVGVVIVEVVFIVAGGRGAIATLPRSQVQLCMLGCRYLKETSRTGTVTHQHVFGLLVMVERFFVGLSANS